MAVQTLPNFHSSQPPASQNIYLAELVHSLQWGRFARKKTFISNFLFSNCSSIQFSNFKQPIDDLEYILLFDVYTFLELLEAYWRAWIKNQDFFLAFSEATKCFCNILFIYSTDYETKITLLCDFGFYLALKNTNDILKLNRSPKIVFL